MAQYKLNIRLRDSSGRTMDLSGETDNWPTLQNVYGFFRDFSGPGAYAYMDVFEHGRKWDTREATERFDRIPARGTEESEER